MARPKKDIDPIKVESLAAIGCTSSEIAAVLGCDKKTLERRFVAVMEKGRERMKESLRRMQFKAARNGNAALLIWLGKQHLDQRDKQWIQQDLNVRELSDDELRAIAAGKGSSGA